MAGLELAEASFVFTQDGNTDGTTDDLETLHVEFESILVEPPGYMVIRTKGWSIDEPEEVSILLARLSGHIRVVCHELDQ